MKSSSKDAGDVVKKSASAHALEIMYTRHHRHLFSRGILQGIADLFWHHIVSQAKALRNRLKIVENILEQEIKNLLNPEQKEVNILSVAGGSLRAVIHAIDKIHKQNIKHKIRVTNVDKNESVIELGRALAKKFAVDDKFIWINDKATNIKSLIPPESVDIIEMVGLLDYFSEEKGIEVISQIYNSLKNNGIFIVGNIYHNSEMLFVKKAGWPQMYYREPQDIEKILKASGFIKEPLIIFEPLKVHMIIIARK